MTTRPTFVGKDEDGDELSVWPSLPGSEKPVIQIDAGQLTVAVEFNKEDAPALAAAILAAAAQSH